MVTRDSYDKVVQARGRVDESSLRQLRWLSDNRRDDLSGRVLRTLTYREREAVKLWCGIGDGGEGYIYSLEEIAKIFKVTRERIRQVIAKAVRKLQHPVRVRMIREAVEQAKRGSYYDVPGTTTHLPG